MKKLKITYWILYTLYITSAFVFYWFLWFSFGLNGVILFAILGLHYTFKAFKNIWNDKIISERRAENIRFHDNLKKRQKEILKGGLN